MNIIVRIITSVIQDRDNNSYDHVVIVYVILSGVSIVVSLALLMLSRKTVDIGHFQWSRKQRIARTDILAEQKRRFHEEDGEKNKTISKKCFGALVLLVVGSWVAYFWGVATGHND
jgi:hypothetical protein